MKNKEKPNAKCIECGKTFYSVVAGFHKEPDEKYYECVCSRKCGKKQGLSDEELKPFD